MVQEGKNVSHILLKYLDKLDLFDIMDLIQSKAKYISETYGRN